MNENVSIAILMMQKNEHQLLKPWLLYHGMRFGFKNLFVYDNGSNREDCIKTLKDFEQIGVNVIWDKNTKIDFERKGVVFSEKIKSLSTEFLFYFPMDCDEFLAAEFEPGDIKIDQESIYASLSSYVDKDAPLSIGAAYDNNPLYPNSFVRNRNQRKTFFYRETCDFLDCGFHIGRTFSKKEPIRTNIVYFHYHFKDYDSYVESAKEKLKGRISDFSKDSLDAFRERKGQGHHVVGKLIEGPEKYYLSLRNNYKNNIKNYFEIKHFSSFIRVLGLDFIDSYISEENRKSGVKSWRGYVENISISENFFVKLTGWFIDLDFEDIDKKIFLSINDRSYYSMNIVFKERPDVYKSQKLCSDKPGFTAIFDIGESACIEKIDSIFVSIERAGVTNKFSLSDKVSSTKFLM